MITNRVHTWMLAFESEKTHKEYLKDGVFLKLIKSLISFEPESLVENEKNVLLA